MKQQPPNQYRRRLEVGPWASTDADGMNGAFSIPLQGFGHKVTANCIVSDGRCADEFPTLAGWEHVSVHIVEFGVRKIPTWAHMCAVKDIFWEPEECCVQYHPAKSAYVNDAPDVLHLWKWSGDFPTPPLVLV